MMHKRHERIPADRIKNLRPFGRGCELRIIVGKKPMPELIADVRSAAADPTVKAILLDMDVSKP
ncbi:hypothetical protein LCGC14_0668530 [marine sediment metagenome]|uniref:Uncharacterized protein n=1 Tax=marine sediment metagenome TaxID=412755 RepID=A0A0F9TD38_9ZZZZ